MFARKLSAVLALLFAAALVAAAAAYAKFASSGSATQPVSTNSLAAPTNVGNALTSACKANKAQQVTVSWTASSPTFATGYTVQRNGTTIATLAATATSYVDNGVGHSTSYTYTVLATFMQWSSGASASPIATC